MDKLAHEGLCVSYARVRNNIQQAISSQLCKQYKKDGIVCPPSLKYGIFTSCTIDNIDHNLSSSTAKKSFHGTSISIFQHPTVEEEYIPFKLESRETYDQFVRELPSNYTEIMPTRGGKAEPPPSQASNISNEKSIAEEALLWTTKLTTNEGTLLDRISFSGFYSQQVVKNICTSTSQLMPLLQESINSPTMVRHCMSVIQGVTKKLNPEQSTMITADQLVYTLGKQIQWMYPDEFRYVFWMMGISILNLIGNWLDGSGCVDVFKKEFINTPGRVESFLQGTNVKRSRYAHQLSLASLLRLARDSFDEKTENLTYDEWKKFLSASSVNASYWFTVIQLEILLFMLVRSVREANFDLLLRRLQDIIPWLFAMDLVHYSRWMSVFIHDLRRLPDTHPDVFQRFQEGQFTIKKSARVFSNMAKDQAHEQNNKLVKIDGGDIGIMENDTALLNWAISGPQISQMLQIFSNSDTNMWDLVYTIRQLIRQVGS